MAGLVHILSAPYPKSYAYSKLQKDCRVGTWVYKRLWTNPKPIDVAFIGSSVTMCAVFDHAVEDRLRDSLNRELHLANLGICRHGVNLHAVVAEDVIRRKKPRLLVLSLIHI